MPRRSILTASEKDSLVSIPESEEELIRYYTLSETDLSIIRQHRGAANRLGFAVQLCCMRYPGIAISTEQSLPQIFLEYLADQLEISSELWRAYGRRHEGTGLVEAKEFTDLIKAINSAKGRSEQDRKEFEEMTFRLQSLEHGVDPDSPEDTFKNTEIEVEA
jgi:hypothetical protein